MVSFNRVILAGHLTRDPELKFTNDGIPVASFGLAVNRRKRRDGGEDQPDFFDVTAWRELGETITNYKKKGDPILVEGRLQYRSWDDRDTGQKRSKVSVVADNVQFLHRSSEGGQGQRRGSADVDLNEEDFDDIPF